MEATPENTTVEKINQKVYRVDKSKKTAVTIKLIADGNWQQVLIFTRTKHGANRLSDKLSKRGIESAAIHGNKSQNARTKALDAFKKGKVRVLVATDIAARGLDIPLLPHVINFELPNIAEDYVHRIGRTGRAGASGQAISLVSIDEVTYVKSIEKLTDQKLPFEIIKGFEPTEKEGDIKKKKPQGKGNPTKKFGRRQSSSQNRRHKKKSSSQSKKRSGN